MRPGILILPGSSEPDPLGGLPLLGGKGTEELEMFSTEPPHRYALSQPERRQLAELCKFVPKPDFIAAYRWEVILLGGAEDISELEATAISNRLGKDVLFHILMYAN